MRAPRIAGFSHPTLVASTGIESGLNSRLRLVALDRAGYMAPWEATLYPWGVEGSHRRGPGGQVLSNPDQLRQKHSPGCTALLLSSDSTPLHPLPHPSSGFLPSSLKP